MAKKKAETPDLFETPVTDAVAAVEPPKKKRGRPSKAELAAREEAAKAAAEKEQPAPEAPAAEETVAPETPAAEEMAAIEEAPMDYTMAPAETEMMPESDMAYNPQDEFGFWEGDPGDGTDFIIVQDIPVEDNGAIPYYDMFDNEVLDISQRPTGEDTLLEALEDGSCEMVLDQNVGLHVLIDDTGEECINEFKGGVRLLFDIAVGNEETT